MSTVTVRQCANCADTMRPRGKWSPHWCAPCDVARMRHIGAFLAHAAGEPYEPSVDDRVAESDVPEWKPR